MSKVTNTCVVCETIESKREFEDVYLKKLNIMTRKRELNEGPIKPVTTVSGEDINGVFCNGCKKYIARFRKSYEDFKKNGYK